MKISVIVPTFRRASDLRRCLRALAAQRRPAHEVLVAVRDGDSESIEVVATTALARRVPVAVPGVIAAMNAGLAAATGEIVALTDDDGEPWPDWLMRIADHFSLNPFLGGVGGRDWQYKGSSPTLDDGYETRCGELQWWGRVIGQHHWAAPGPPRDVAVVKGVNCAYRTEVLRSIGGFDTRLTGTGAQVHWELSLGLAIRRAGWRLVFDPALGVNHYPAERFDEDQRGRFSSTAQQNMVYNETLVLAEHLPPLRRAAFIVWSMALGTRASPGLGQLLRLLALREPHVWPRYRATLDGRVRALRRGRSTPISPKVVT